MNDEELEQAITEIDDSFVIQAINLNTKRRSNNVKKIAVLVAVAVCLNTLVAYHTGYRFQYFIGSFIAKVSDSVNTDGNIETKSGLTFDWNNDKPYKIENGEILFSFDGSNRIITEFCSVNNCYLYENVDFFGNGYIIAVGGTPENTGDLIAFFEGGKKVSHVLSVASGEEYDDYYAERNPTYKNHQWTAAINYELNIRDTWYLNYYTEEQRFEYVDSQKPYEPYTITVEKG